MNREHLDARIQEAVREARASVSGLSAEAMSQRSPWAHAGRRARRVATGGVLAVAAVAGLMATTLLVSTDDGGDEATNVAAGPPTESQMPPPPPSPAPDGRPPTAVTVGEGHQVVHRFEPVIAEGRLPSGEAWLLGVGGPDDGLCLAVAAASAMPITCSSTPLGPALPGDDAYRPLVHGDNRVPPVVFGRMPAGITEVEVALANGARTERSAVFPGEYGPFYAVAVPGDTAPAAVIGLRDDGTSVRYELHQ
ncbi:MAG TPA: hypothetical protein VGR26_05850 [Acidimicrobiales bacterium]|nr:hypothetical protein [Acidimicrobiales bacterium]